MNNAGIAHKPTVLEDVIEAEWNTMIGINLTGQFLGTKAALGALKASAPSSIINISSIAGLVGFAGTHANVAAKFGLRGLTKSVAAELGASGVRANSIHPGVIRTPILAGMDASSVTGVLNRLSEPEVVSSLVVYLASENQVTAPDRSSLSMEDNWHRGVSSPGLTRSRNRGQRNNSRA